MSKVEKVATDAQIKESRTRIAQIITNLKNLRICESAVKTLFLLFFLNAFCGKKTLRPLRKTLRPLRLRKIFVESLKVEKNNRSRTN